MVMPPKPEVPTKKPIHPLQPSLTDKDVEGDWNTHWLAPFMTTHASSMEKTAEALLIGSLIPSNVMHSPDRTPLSDFEAAFVPPYTHLNLGTESILLVYLEAPDPESHLTLMHIIINLHYHHLLLNISPQPSPIPSDRQIPPSNNHTPKSISSSCVDSTLTVCSRPLRMYGPPSCNMNCVSTWFLLDSTGFL